METILMKTENSKMNKLHKFVNFSKLIYLLHLEKYKATIQKQ